MKQGQIFYHKRSKHIHWHVLMVSGNTVHMYSPSSNAYKSINTRLSKNYKRWYPPTGVERVKA